MLLRTSPYRTSPS